MADIFISYARVDRECARRLARALESRSWTVWWDPDLHAGERFEDVIEREIDRARATIVIWSISSVKSRFVRDEAAHALDQDKLVPVRIDHARLPMRFNLIQTPNLSQWLAHQAVSDHGPNAEAQVTGGASEYGGELETLIRDLNHRFARSITEVVDNQPPVPPSPPRRAMEFRWDQRRHSKSYETYGIIEDNDLVIVKEHPQTSIAAGGALTIAKKGLVVPKTS
jgi:hypothetical protein